MAILSLGAEARLDFWSSLEDAEADCAAAAAAADSTSSTESSGIETVRCRDCLVGYKHVWSDINMFGPVSLAVD